MGGTTITDTTGAVITITGTITIIIHDFAWWH
jgi:hypothetical protein